MVTSGQFGDTFGGLNALFSGLAFAAVVVTLLTQREELKLQRKELRLQREEMKRFAEAQEGSKTALEDQVYNLEKTARVNAQTTLIETYRFSLERAEQLSKTFGFTRPFELDHNQTMERISELVQGLEKEIEKDGV